MKSLIASLLLWIGAETSYNVDLPHPEIMQIEKPKLEEIFYGSSKDGASDLHAFYNIETDVIYLSSEWNMHNAFDRGVLLHELIHYVQDMNKVPYDCVGQLEAEVYPLQEKYMLEMHGVKFEYDEFFVKLLSLCDSFNQNNF